MIDHIEDKITIGTIDIFEFDPFHKRAGIGILIGNESYRRKGYASMVSDLSDKIQFQNSSTRINCIVIVLAK